jgi:hypothetical protein
MCMCAPCSQGVSGMGLVCVHGCSTYERCKIQGILVLVIHMASYTKECTEGTGLLVRMVVACMMEAARRPPHTTAGVAHIQVQGQGHTQVLVQAVAGGTQVQGTPRWVLLVMGPPAPRDSVLVPVGVG